MPLALYRIHRTVNVVSVLNIGNLSYSNFHTFEITHSLYHNSLVYLKDSILLVVAVIQFINQFKDNYGVHVRLNVNGAIVISLLFCTSKWPFALKITLTCIAVILTDLYGIHWFQRITNNNSLYKLFRSGVTWDAKLFFHWLPKSTSTDFISRRACSVHCWIFSNHVVVMTSELVGYAPPVYVGWLIW